MPGSCTIVADFIPFSFMCHSTFVSAVDSVSLLPVEHQVLSSGFWVPLISLD